MGSRKSHAEMSAWVSLLHGGLTDIVGIVNRPQVDAMMVRKAGISLDRALFPLLVGIAQRGPIGVVELADRVGRDYTTVSRQVAKLESLGLVRRALNEKDRRVRQAIVTDTGRAMTAAVDAARESISQTMFETWEPAEIEDLVRLVRKLADAMIVHYSGVPPIDS